MEKKKIVLALILAATMIIYPILSATFEDDTQGEFDLGTYSNTQWDFTNSWVELTTTGQTNGSGTYTSNVKDATGVSIWNTIAWQESIPYKEELPNNKASDSGAIMTNNVLLMHMNETSGATTIVDTSGESPANNGTTFNSPTLGAPGRYNTSISFDGTNDYVRVPDAPNLDNTSQLTIEAWVYPTNLSGIRGIVCKREGVLIGNAYSVYFIGNRLYVEINDGFDGPVSSVATFSTNRWYHIVVVYDGTQSSGQRVRIYINGSLDATRSEASASIPNYGSRLWIGTLPLFGFPTFYFRGTMDEMAIYQNRVLDVNEIINHYKRGVLNLTLSAISCDDAACSGETYPLTPDFTTPGPNTLSVPNNRYFQYQVYFTTEDSRYSPELKSVTIDYTITTHPLAVSIVGGGMVTSNPAGIDCGSDCIEVYNDGTLVTLTATPTATSTFVGWSGDCTGTALTCTVTMDATKNVTATFGLKQRRRVQLPSMLPVAQNHIILGNDLLIQAKSLVSQAQSKNLDTTICEKLITEASELLSQSENSLTNPIYANNLAMKAIEKLKQTIECLKALLG